MDAKTEMNAELRRARGWLIAVGAIQFTLDMIFIHGVYKDQLTDEWKTRITVLSAALLGAFLVLAAFTRRAPRLCLGLGLALFWAVHLFNAALDPATLAQGIIIKILFTMALVKGFKAAAHAEDLRKDLQRVFE